MNETGVDCDKNCQCWYLVPVIAEKAIHTAQRAWEGPLGGGVDRNTATFVHLFSEGFYPCPVDAVRLQACGHT